MGASSLIAEPPPAITESGTLIQYSFNFPNAGADGGILAWDYTIACQYVTGNCLPGREDSTTTQSVITGTQLPDVMTSLGSLRASRNGRYFLAFCCLNSGAPPLAEFYDAQTAILTPLPNYTVIGDGRGSIADDGTVLLGQGSTMVLWKNGSVTQLPIRAGLSDASARLSADGSMLVYQGVDTATGDADLLSYDVNTGTQTSLALGPIALTFAPLCGCPNDIGPYFHPWVSDDGQRVLFLAADSAKVIQAFASNSDGTGMTQITTAAYGIAEAVLSGDGYTAFAVAQSGALLEIDVGNSGGTSRSSLPDVPIIGNGNQPLGALVPGSQVIFILAPGLPAPRANPSSTRRSSGASYLSILGER